MTNAEMDAMLDRAGRRYQTLILEEVRVGELEKHVRDLVAEVRRLQIERDNDGLDWARDIGRQAKWQSQLSLQSHGSGLLEYLDKKGNR